MRIEHASGLAVYRLRHLLAILVLTFVLWRWGAPALAVTALVLGMPIWFGWEYARPTWTTGLITGTEVSRSDPDAPSLPDAYVPRNGGDGKGIGRSPSASGTRLLPKRRL